MTNPKIPPAVEIEHWSRARVTAGDTIERYSIVYEGKAVITRETEFECRVYARDMHWVVTRVYEEVPS